VARYGLHRNPCLQRAVVLTEKLDIIGIWCHSSMDRYNCACCFAGRNGFDNACRWGSISMDWALRSTPNYDACFLGPSTGLDHCLWLDRHLRDTRLLDRYPNRGSSDPQRLHVYSQRLARDFTCLGYPSLTCALQHLRKKSSRANRDYRWHHSHHFFDRIRGGSRCYGSAK
jgi:hypothetical protein